MLCVSGDFNGDGYTDLAVACHKEYGNHNSHSSIFWGGPEGLSDERRTVLPTTGPHGMCTVDPGNILDRGPREHYTSEVFDLAAGRRVRSMRRYENVCFDYSAHGADRDGTLRLTIDHVGRERVLFGTDYPGESPAGDLAAAFHEDLTDGELEAFLNGNARRLLNM